MNFYQTRLCTALTVFLFGVGLFLAVWVLNGGAL